MPTVSSDIRRLVPGDESRIAAFLNRHADSSMILRSNLCDPGLGDGARDFHGVWVGRFAGEELTGVAAHFGIGNLVVQAPADPAGVARAVLTLSRRPFQRILGPWDQAMGICEGLGLTEMPQPKPEPEILFALDLTTLCIPIALERGAVLCRAPTTQDVPLLTEWRAQYCVAALHASPGPALIERSRKDIVHSMERGAAFALEENGRVVAMTFCNARVPECVQVGGVWTPPEWRGRGYARAVVAGSLLAARNEGVSRSVLFTEIGNVAAQHAYIALGYREVGRYAMLLFDEPQEIQC